LILNFSESKFVDGVLFIDKRKITEEEIEHLEPIKIKI